MLWRKIGEKELCCRGGWNTSSRGVFRASLRYKQRPEGNKGWIFGGERFLSAEMANAKTKNRSSAGYSEERGRKLYDLIRK